MVDSQGFTETALLHEQELLTSQIKRRVDELSALNRVAAVVSQSLDLDVTLQTAMDAVLSVIPVEASGISLIEEHTNDVVLRAQKGWKQDFVTRPMRVKGGTGLSGMVISTGDVVVTGDLSGDPRLVVQAVADEHIQAMAMAPMHARGKIIGILSVMSYQPYRFDPQQIDVLKAIADQVGLALDNARLYAAAQEAQQRVLAVLQSTADAIIATDQYEAITLINRTAEQWFNVSAEQALYQALRALPFPDDVLAALQKAIVEFAGSPQIFEVTLPDNRTLSGALSPVAMAPDFGGQASGQGWVIVFQDITHIRAAERARLQFIQTAAHDLRNPLGATLSALTMLRRGWNDMTETEAEIFSIATRGLNRMQDLIDDLLNLEKVESGLDMPMGDVDVHALIERTATDMSPVLAQRGQHLNIEIARSLPTLRGNAHWLARALMNLISNAYKYGREGGQITLRAFCVEGAYHLEVQDDGPGIPIEAQARLFERFYRAPEVRDKVHGTGLGLAIVKSIAEQHGGYATVHSVPGQGATFSLILPCPPEP